jgi:hypothetical protein
MLPFERVVVANHTARLLPKLVNKNSLMCKVAQPCEVLPNVKNVGVNLHAFQLELIACDQILKKVLHNPRTSHFRHSVTFRMATDASQWKGTHRAA